MSLPDPIPDDPRKWEGWRAYSSWNYYERLGFTYEENPTEAQIEEACRKQLVWWQKKLPLKSQPSNPLAQLLRDGLDEATQYLVEARSFLLDPAKRAAFNQELLSKFKQNAGDEFRKYVNFAITSGQLAARDEASLMRVGQENGLETDEIIVIIESQLAERGARRADPEPDFRSGTVTPTFQGQPGVSYMTPVPVNLPMPGGPAYPPPGGYVTPNLGFGAPQPLSARDEFRRILRGSGLNADGISDDQRQAFVSMAVNMGVDEIEAEDLLDAYLDGSAEEEIAQPQAPPPNLAPPPGYYQPAPGYAYPGYAQSPMQGYPQVPHQSPNMGMPPYQTPSLAPGPGVPQPPAQEEAQTPRATPVPEPETRLSPTQERQKYEDFTNTLGMQMRLVYSGTFPMGNDSMVAMPHERPVRQVSVSRFYMARHPVTNVQYEAFDPGHKLKRPEWSKDNHPVVNVTSHEAAKYCEWLTLKEGGQFIYRLPTEAEWEYAARGGDSRTYPWGNSKGRGDVANYADVNTRFAWSDRNVNDGHAYTSPVGTYPRGASPFGIEDLAGNVWEWCQDYYGLYRADDIKNPKGVPRSDKRVCRGGSWRSKLASLRTSFRHFNVLNYSFLDQGFRVVRDCDPPKTTKK